MTITTTKPTGATGLSVVAGGLLFLAVQFKHPILDATFASTESSQLDPAGAR